MKNAGLRLLRYVSDAAESMLALLMPWRCLICGGVLPSDTLWHYLCQQCFDRLQPAPPPPVLGSIADEHLDPDERALSHVMARWSAHPTQRPGLFDLIYALKYYGYWRIGVELGIELGAAIHLLRGRDYDAIIPVPIHPARRRERGYNQSEAIAEGVQHILRIPRWTDALRRTRYTQSQTTLSAADRRTNTRGAFGAGTMADRLRGAQLLIVDDVFTTGSTLNSVALAALEHGAASVDAATLVAAVQ